ncbi:MAG: tyrosine-type recombinase/integrase [Anaerolineae bacterium]
MTGRDNGSKALTIREGERPDLPTQYALSKVNTATVSFKRNARQRRSVVREFLEWVGKPAEEITPEHVEAWRAQQDVDGVAASTLYKDISFISQFFEYLVGKGLIRFNPVPKGKWRNSFRPKPYSSEKVKALSPQQVKSFLGAIDRETAQGARLYAMCLAMLHTGMRAAEVCGILWKDSSLDGGPPTVRTRVKGGEWVTFELTEEAAEAIGEYLRIAKRRPRGTHALFCPVTKRKKGGKRYQPLDTFYLWDQVKRIARKVGLDMNVHTFRHTFAQLYHESGASQPEVQGALGHKSGATTRLYLDRLAPRSAKAGRAVQKALQEAPRAP